MNCSFADSFLYSGQLWSGVCMETRPPGWPSMLIVIMQGNVYNRLGKPVFLQVLMPRDPQPAWPVVQNDGSCSTVICGRSQVSHAWFTRSGESELWVISILKLHCTSVQFLSLKAKTIQNLTVSWVNTIIWESGLRLPFTIYINVHYIFIVRSK